MTLPELTGEQIVAKFIESGETLAPSVLAAEVVYSGVVPLNVRATPVLFRAYLNDAQTIDVNNPSAS